MSPATLEEYSWLIALGGILVIGLIWRLTKAVSRDMHETVQPFDPKAPPQERDPHVFQKARLQMLLSLLLLVVIVAVAALTHFR